MKKWLLLLLAACANQPALTPTDQRELEGTQATLAHCRDIGNDAGTYKAYDDCKKAGGL